MAGVGISWYLVNDRLFQAASPGVEAHYQLKMGLEAHTLKKEEKPSVPVHFFAAKDADGDFWENVTSNGPGAVLTPSSPDMPDDQLSFYRDPKFHVHVLTTLISTAMKITGYVPGAAELLSEAAGAAEAETKAFVQFLRKLSGYGQYITTVDSDNQWISNEEKNCDKLISAVSKFMEASKDVALGDKSAILGAMIDSIKGVAQALSSNVTNIQGKTCFKQFNIVGTKALNPCVGIYFCTVEMKTRVGKGVYAQSQKLQVYRVTYELNSMSVSADSRILAAAKITAAQELADEINKYHNSTKGEKKAGTH